MTTNDFDAFIASLMETDLQDLEHTPTKDVPSVKYPCGQCAGTGRYQGARVHQEKSHCFACRGTGYFKSSPEARLKHRQAAAARARNKLEAGIAAFAEQEPAMFADLKDVYQTNCGGNEFIYSLASQLFRKGFLSDRQVAAWHRGKARLEEIRAQRAAEAEKSKVAVDLAAIRGIFDNAKASGLKKTAYRAEGLVIKAAPDHGVNAGALYVTMDDEYMGKVVGAVFHPVRSAPATVGEALQVIAADPKEAAIRWGRKTGRCSCCGRELSDPASVALGIGPICADKWF